MMPRTPVQIRRAVANLTDALEVITDLTDAITQQQVLALGIAMENIAAVHRSVFLTFVDASEMSKDERERLVAEWKYQISRQSQITLAMVKLRSIDREIVIDGAQHMQPLNTQLFSRRIPRSLREWDQERMLESLRQALARWPEDHEVLNAISQSINAIAR